MARIRRNPAWLIIPAWLGAAAIVAWLAPGARAEIHPSTSTVTIAPNSVTLGTDTIGSYAAGDAEAGNATGVACADCVTLTTETAGNYVASITFGAGLSGTAASEGSTPTAATDSSEADFLKSGALTCGAATQGKAQVHTTPLQYCDNSATPTLRYSAYGDSTGKATAVAANSVALGTDTTGNYALGDAEGGAATTGDSATAFFGAGSIETSHGGLGADNSASTGIPLFTTGTVAFQRWQGSGFILCQAGLEATSICKTFTNLTSATFTTAGNTQATVLDLDVVTQMRVFGRLSTAAANNSTLGIQCDTDSTFGSPTLCATATVTTSTGNFLGSWTALGTAGGDCVAASAWCRAGMGSGDGVADPVAVFIGMGVR